MNTIAGTSLHDAFSDTRAITPQTIQTQATARRKPGGDGRRPGWTGPSSAGREPLEGGADRAGPELRGLPFDGLRPFDFGMHGTLLAFATSGGGA